MSVFICSKCGCIEHVDLVIPEGAVNDGEHHFLTPEEMIGRTPRVIEDSEGNVIKKENEPMMLCSECNTGVRHDKFLTMYPDDNDRLNATFSKYQMVIPFDHPKGILVADDTKRSGWALAGPGSVGINSLIKSMNVQTQDPGTRKLLGGKTYIQPKMPQSETEKASKLKAAEEKRLAKLARKSNV